MHPLVRDALAFLAAAVDADHVGDQCRSLIHISLGADRENQEIYATGKSEAAKCPSHRE